MKTILAGTALVAVLGLACASGTMGDEFVWKRPCGTAEQREADRSACLTDAAGIADPSGRGVEFTQDLFAECMQQRGWKRVPSDTVMRCEDPSQR